MATTLRALFVLSLLSPSLAVAREPKRKPLIKIKDPIVLEGRAHKPRAFLVLRRSSVGWDPETADVDLLSRVGDATAQVRDEAVEEGAR